MDKSGQPLILLAALITAGSISAGAMAQDWHGVVETRTDATQEDTPTTVSVDPSDALGAQGSIRFEGSRSCRIQVEWVTGEDAKGEPRVYAVEDTSPSGFCKRYRYGRLQLTAQSSQCGVHMELSPHSDLRRIEGTHSVVGTLACAGDP